MFKFRYDLTEGKIIRRVSNRTAAMSRTHSSSPRSRTRYGTAMTNVTAPMAAGGGQSQRYSPVFERAEDPTLAEDFLPADPQTQNKIFRNLMMFDAIAGPATEYWRDLAFSQNVILSGIGDEKVLQFYQDAIYGSGILPMMPMLLSDYLTFGKFVYHQLMDESKGYWTETIPHDLDYVSISVSPVPSLDPLIDLQPTEDQRMWATSSDPRVIDQRGSIDPVLINMMAAGQPIPLAPENTMFLPRQTFATAYYGTSYLTRIMRFKIYEKALLDASISGARRRAGPLWHITVWPDATDDEMSEVLDLFFAAEEDPIGGKVVTREGVVVTPVGGGAGDFWKLSDEWAFLSEAKMRALGISETFLSGEANWNSMEVVLSTFLEKVRAVRYHFTQKILIEKMCTQLARMHGFVKRSKAEISHRVRTGGPRGGLGRTRNEPALLIPTIEWDKPLSPVADRDFIEILDALEEKGIPIPIRQRCQVSGFDIDKALDSFDSDLETKKRIYEQQIALASLREQFGIDESGTPTGTEGGGEDFDFGEGLGGEEDFGGGADLGGEEPAGGAEEAPPAAPEAPGAPEEGFGASTEGSRFNIDRPRLQQVLAGVKEGTVRNLIGELDQIPLWDENKTVFGVPQRRMAKILDRILRSDPDKHKRTKVAKRLLIDLERKEGLTRRQAEATQYVATRMGIVPPVELPSEVFEPLVKYVLDRVNGNGINKKMAHEIRMLSRISEACGRDRSHTSSKFNPQKMMPTFERYLPEHQTLTGLMPNDSPFNKG